MLQLKKRKAFFLMWMVCVCLCACSGGSDEVILIGSEEIGDSEEVPSEVVSVENDAEETICVYVCGAVEDPGVVEIFADSRVEDALVAAGGFAENANRTCVNLAAWVTDGQMIYVPAEEEMNAGQSTWEQVQVAGISSSAINEDGLVNINTAGTEQLCTLPGIGQKRAADIIAYREENGFFETCEDIMHVPGIKSGLFEKIHDKITVE